MPNEDRRLIFNYSETYQALYKLSTKSDDVKKLKPGIIRKVEVDGLDKNIINVYLENPQEGDKYMASFTRDFTAAALMMYCRGSGIPLPRKASKTILIEDQKMVLRVMV